MQVKEQEQAQQHICHPAAPRSSQALAVDWELKAPEAHCATMSPGDKETQAGARREAGQPGGCRNRWGAGRGQLNNTLASRQAPLQPPRLPAGLCAALRMQAPPPPTCQRLEGWRGHQRRQRLLLLLRRLRAARVARQQLGEEVGADAWLLSGGG